MTLQLVIAGVVGLVLLVAAWPLLMLKFYSGKAGCRVELMELIGLRMRLGSMELTRRVVGAWARGQELGVPRDRIQTGALCGADVVRILDAMEELRRRGKPAVWQDLLVCDLAGRDVVAIVRAGADPGKVIGSAEFEGRFGKGG